MSSEPSERDLDELADAVVERLEPGSYGDKMLLNRRQLMALAGAGVSAGALGTLGVTEAEAQSVVGQVGTDQERVDVYGGEGDFQSVSAEKIFSSSIDPDYLIEQQEGSWIAWTETGTIASGNDAATVAQAAVDDAVEDDVILVKGDATINNPITITKRIELEWRGKVTLSSDFIHFTGAGDMVEADVRVNEIDGQQRSNGYIAFLFRGARHCTVWFNWAHHLGHLCKFHASAEGEFTADNHVRGVHAAVVNIHFEAFAEHANCEGNILYDARLFNAHDKTIWQHDANGYASLYGGVFGGVIHGGDAANANYEILEEGNAAKNIYYTPFLSDDAPSTIADSSVVQSANFAVRNQMVDMEWGTAGDNYLGRSPQGVIEIGDSESTSAAPFIDWHLGVGSPADYNIRQRNLQDGLMGFESLNGDTMYLHPNIGGVRLPLQSTQPTGPGTGDIYFDDGTNTADGEPHLRAYTGSAWIDL